MSTGQATVRFVRMYLPCDPSLGQRLLSIRPALPHRCNHSHNNKTGRCHHISATPAVARLRRCGGGGWETQRTTQRVCLAAVNKTAVVQRNGPTLLVTKAT